MKTGTDSPRCAGCCSQKRQLDPTPFLVVMVCWLTLILASFSLFARPTPPVFVTLLVCALAVSSAIFLIWSWTDRSMA